MNNDVGVIGLLWQGAVLQFNYTNWKNEFGERKIVVYNIFFGHTEFHPENQWLMDAYDIKKDAKRVFAMKDMSDVVILS